MDKNQFRQDILTTLHVRKIKLNRLALESGIDGKSLWLFMKRKDANLNTNTLFRLWPHIYGEQAPVPLVLLPVSTSLHPTPTPEREEA